MKYIVLLIIAFSSFQALCQSTIGDIGNTSCASAYKLCDRTQLTQNYDFTSTSELCGNVSLYYIVEYDYSINQGIYVQSSSSISYEWYGPTTVNGVGACELIENYSTGVETGTLSPNVEQGLSGDAGFYILKVTMIDCSGSVTIRINNDLTLNCSKPVLCTECITSFSPNSGDYIVSAWVKESNADPTTTSYSNVSIEISFTGDPITYSLIPSGEIIDGWQRIESTIQIPINATGLDISLEVSSGDAYFDDIRFFPYDGSMMSYVYDPISLRLMAELDERNYATFYEYDEEGKLIRVKKETEKGVMTIQENRDNIKKN